MKTCKKCGLDKPLSDYTVDTRYKDGRYPWCAACRAAYRREKRHGAKRDETLAYFRDWNDQNRDRVRELNNSHYHRHKDELSAKRREYDRNEWHNNPKTRERKNRQKLRMYYENPTHRARHLTNAKINVHKRRALVRGLGTHFTLQEWRDLCEHYGNHCLKCGATGPLVPDHVIPLSRGGSNTIDNIQPLCSDCNARKHAHTVDYRPGRGS